MGLQKILNSLSEVGDSKFVTKNGQIRMMM